MFIKYKGDTNEAHYYCNFTVFFPAQNKADDVKTFALKNGMQIIVLEDHYIPNVAMYLFYKVDWRNEYPGITGNSHFFEP